MSRIDRHQPTSLQTGDARERVTELLRERAKLQPQRGRVGCATIRRPYLVGR